MIAAFAPLRRLTDAGIAVLLPHHPAKGNPSPGQAARGSGALSGLADVLLELRLANAPDPADRRRRLFCYSRNRETPPLVRFALNDDGTDYTLVAEAEQPAGDFPPEPFRYWLAAREQEWLKNPLYRLAHRLPPLESGRKN